MKNRKEVIIIGGGLGGIATAIFLSQRNFNVTIIEKNGNIGGKMNFFTKNGYSFDTGPSLITIPHIFENMFSRYLFISWILCFSCFLIFVFLVLLFFLKAFLFFT